ncbi:MAG TPA: hypothetical protein VMM36_19625 [Opitutaceae bacterium]|nr:hypothetical protein [Opitutaceae bacterium]
MSRSGRIDQDLVNTITGSYKQAAFWKAYSDVQLKALFTPEELTDIKALLAEMKAAADDNTRRAAAIERFSGVVAKILKVAKIVV